MRVLVVDDDPDSVLTLIQAFDEDGLRHWECDFGAAQAALTDYMPDLVVLDLQDQQVQPAAVDAGNTVYEELIWKSHFCPVVVYSGYADQFEINHKPLVKAVSKGGGAEDLVRAAIEELRPYSESLAILRRDIDGVARDTLKQLMLAIAEEQSLNGDQRTTLAVGMGRRRAAAYLDDQDPEPKHLPETQFVYPTSGTAYRFADVLRSNGAANDDPTSYKLVLSPSCDLQPRKGTPKTEGVLVARCIPIPLGTRGLPEVPMNQDKWSEVKAHLQSGFFNGLVFLPQFLTQTPAMCADLKCLEVLPGYAVNAAGTCEAPGYKRVVSVDSPFRERIAWAFMSTAARPGVPQIDLTRWVNMYK
jgi:CheY-like chemotaxis protein